MRDNKLSRHLLVGPYSKIFYAATTAILAIVVLSGWSLSSTTVQASDNRSNALDESGLTDGSTQAPIPTNTPRVGTPMLVAYPLALLPEKHVEVNEEDYPWIARTIRSGEIPITEQEMEEYFGLYSIAKSHYFAVNSVSGSTSYYSIEYREPLIVLEQYNAKAYKLDIPPEKSITVRLKEQPWLRQLVSDSHTWQPIDENSARVLKQLSDIDQTFNFKVIHDDGREEYYNIRYAGPELSRLS